MNYRTVPVVAIVLGVWEICGQIAALAWVSISQLCFIRRRLITYVLFIPFSRKGHDLPEKHLQAVVCRGSFRVIFMVVFICHCGSVSHPAQNSTWIGHESTLPNTDCVIHLMGPKM